MSKADSGIIGKYCEGNSPFDNTNASMNDVIEWMLEKKLRRVAWNLVKEDIDALDDMNTPTLNVDSVDKYTYSTLLSSVGHSIRLGDTQGDDYRIPELCDKYLETAMYRIIYDD